jgi:protocatechuate 3,4-dioxygenase beta subunit
VATPTQTAGPFYPDELPVDADNDLVLIEGALREAGGEPLELSGRIVDLAGAPVAGGLVEIWQCDANGRYLSARDWSHFAERDPYFQGFGRSAMDDDGRYRFRTIRPVPYSSRTPHIHFRIYSPKGPELTTQMYVAGESRNAHDVIYGRLSEAEQARVTVPLEPIGEAAWRTRFDIVLPGTG